MSRFFDEPVLGYEALMFQGKEGLGRVEKCSRDQWPEECTCEYAVVQRVSR
jgi:hypothetical protein